MQSSWEDWKHFIATSINGSINASVVKSPHSIIYDIDKRLPYDILAGKSTPAYNMDDYSVRQLQVFNSIHCEVRKYLEASRHEMMLKQHAKAAKIEAAVGDTVMIKSPERVSKLTPKFLGPFTITKLAHGNEIDVKHISTGKEETVHVDRCKKITVTNTLSTDTMN